MKSKFWLGMFMAAAMCSNACAHDIFEALSAAYTTNPSLKAQRAYARAVDEDVSIAKSGYRPTMYLTAGYSEADKSANTLAAASGRDTRGKALGAVVSQPVFSGFSTVNSVKAADSYARAELYNLANVEQNILLSGATAYLDVLRDAMIVELQRNNENLLKKRLDETRERFNVGELTRTDVSQSEARYSQAKASRISSEGDLEASRSEYVQIIGMDPVELEEPETIISLVPANIEEVLSFARDHNFEILQAKHIMESREHEVNANTGALLPQVSLDGAATKNRGYVNGVHGETDVESLEWSVNLRVPLYDAGADRAKIRRSKYQKWQAQELVLVTERQVTSDITSYWEYLLANSARITAIIDQTKANEIALDGVQKEESVGNRTVLDVLDAYQELLNSKVEEVKARRDYYLSAMQLLLSMGKLTAKDLNLSVELYNAKEEYKETRDRWISTSINK
ncbi:MAG: TolC family outer membrane protein [Lactobacillaceae bacterium]|nr:TolC family outer membrane protein [Lactobacillaceae bacterium]